MPAANQGPNHVPSALTRWIEYPVPDRFLGLKILTEMAMSTALLGFNVQIVSRPKEKLKGNIILVNDSRITEEKEGMGNKITLQ